MKEPLRTLINSTLALGIAAPLLAQVTLSVSGNMDIYRAGAYNDGSDGIVPAVYSFPARPFQTLTFSSVAGVWTCNSSVSAYGADGTSLSTGRIPPGGANIGNPVGTFSGYDTTEFSGAMVGMFLSGCFTHRGIVSVTVLRPFFRMSSTTRGRGTGSTGG